METEEVGEEHMARDFLNVIERALIMGISDSINLLTGADVDGDNVYVYGSFPETEELKFPAIVVQQVVSGVEENFYGEDITFGGETATGEAYGIGFFIHLITDKETAMSISGIDYKQRRLLNWLMLNVANALKDIDWSIYQEDDLEILERHVHSWNDIGHMPQLHWYGATCRMSVIFLNKR